MTDAAAAANTVWTLGRLLTWTSDFLARQQVGEPRLSAEVLLAHAAGCRRIELYTRFDQQLPAERLNAFRELVKRAGTREPIAYLVGEKEFFSLPFAVNRHVLIPRPETELLVELAIEHCRRRALHEAKFLDVGTGSGCIAVAVLKHLPEATCVGTDISPEALAVAQQNAGRHGVAGRLRLVQADRLALPEDAVPAGRFDVVVCNPPYIAGADVAGLDPTVREHEPRHALTDEAEGLSFFAALAEAAPHVLHTHGWVIVEVGAGQAERVRQTMTAGDSLVHRNTVKDRVTGQERVLEFERA